MGAQDGVSNVSGIGVSQTNEDNDTQTSIDQHDQSLVDYGEDTYGTKLLLTESSIGTIYSTDFGAIEAGRQISLGAVDAAARAADAARSGFDQVADLFRLKGESDIIPIIKTLGLVGVVAWVLWLIFAPSGKGGSK